MIRTEFAPAHQAGYFRFSFPNGNAELHVKNLHTGSLHAVAENAVAGEESVMGMTAYFYAETSEPVSAETAREKDGDHLTLSARGAKVLEFRYGVSFIAFRIGVCQRANGNLHGPWIPFGRWGQAMWVSDRDLCRAFEHAIDDERIDF